MRVTVDLVVLTIRDGVLNALLIRRGIPPYKGRWALPGGFVLDDEDLPAAAERELREETGVATAAGHLEQLRTYGGPRRDPRGRVVSVAYLALLPDLPAPTAGSDAAGAQWRPTASGPAAPGLRSAGSAATGATREGGASLGPGARASGASASSHAPASRLAFDHDEILRDGVERARAKLEYTPLAAAFCPAEFTIAELRGVYEAVWGTAVDPRNFHRKVTTTDGFVRSTGRRRAQAVGRPAELFQQGDADVLYPPVLRPR